MDAPRRRGRPSGRSGTELLEVARDVFLAKGYEEATLAEIAARAEVSKASLYREHPSKGALYAAVVADWAAAGRDSMKPVLDRLARDEDLRAALIQFSRTLRDAVLSPEVARMRQLVTSEAERFPQVAAGYLADSWMRNIQALADTLASMGDRGRLRVADPVTAANHLTWLVVGPQLNAHAYGVSLEHDDVEEAVDLFLAGYAA